VPMSLELLQKSARLLVRQRPPSQRFSLVFPRRSLNTLSRPLRVGLPALSAALKRRLPFT
jgi:hypothetical protein